MEMSGEKLGAAAAFDVTSKRSHGAFAFGSDNATDGTSTGEIRSRIEAGRFDFGSAAGPCAITRTIRRAATRPFDARIAAGTGRGRTAHTSATTRSAVSTRSRCRFSVDDNFAATPVKRREGQRECADEHQSSPLHDVAS